MTADAGQLYERLLVVRCQAGDEAALGELIARYTPRIRFFLKRVARAGSLDDLLQEIWFDVYRGLPKLNDPAAFTAWLYRIARDRAYRDLRQRATPEALPVGELPEPEEEEPFTAEEAGRVRAALDALPDPHREILVLRFLEELSYEQMAEILGHPVGTVRSRLHYAKAALREKMETPSFRKELLP